MIRPEIACIQFFCHASFSCIKDRITALKYKQLVWSLEAAIHFREEQWHAQTWSDHFFLVTPGKGSSGRLRNT